MCGSPRSLPRAPSCDTGATESREAPGGRVSGTSPSVCPRLPLSPPLWPSKHLLSGTLNPSPGREGPD